MSWHRGALRSVPIARVQRVRATNHRVVRLQLHDGTVLEISGQHPTADGRLFRDLRPGDWLAGATIERAETVHYPHRYTYDILPASETGTYVAGGVLIGTTISTVTRAPESVAP